LEANKNKKYTQITQLKHHKTCMFQHLPICLLKRVNGNVLVLNKISVLEFLKKYRTYLDSKEKKREHLQSKRKVNVAYLVAGLVPITNK
jgi:hypothetical protein